MAPYTPSGSKIWLPSADSNQISKSGCGIEPRCGRCLPGTGSAEGGGHDPLTLRASHLFSKQRRSPTGSPSIVAETKGVEPYTLRYAPGSNRAQHHCWFSLLSGRQSTRNSALAGPSVFEAASVPDGFTFHSKFVEYFLKSLLGGDLIFVKKTVLGGHKAVVVD